MESETTQLIEARSLVKTWHRNGQRIEILTGVDLSVKHGETVAITGASGCGKSTLLNILAMLTIPDSGRLKLFGERPEAVSPRRRLDLRRRIGVVFQDAKLLPHLSALDNVCLPLAHRHLAKSDQLRLGRNALAAVGMADREEHLPQHLSGGEMTRVSIARTLVVKPDLLLCDEPTGALDQANESTVIGLLMQCTPPRGALVVVTHKVDLALQADRTLELRDGHLQEVRE